VAGTIGIRNLICSKLTNPGLIARFNAALRRTP
jgi:hypothetical protein